MQLAARSLPATAANSAFGLRLCVIGANAACRPQFARYGCELGVWPSAVCDWRECSLPPAVCRRRTLHD
eukprot:5751175-Prymnesium_polylepis.1